MLSTLLGVFQRLCKFFWSFHVQNFEWVWLLNMVIFLPPTTHFLLGRDHDKMSRILRSSVCVCTFYNRFVHSTSTDSIAYEMWVSIEPIFIVFISFRF